jgi:hypothetical protein
MLEREAGLVKENQMPTSASGVVYMGPALFSPLLYGLLVSLASPVFRFLTAPIRAPKDFPHVRGVVAHSKGLCDDRTHPRQRQ